MAISTSRIRFSRVSRSRAPLFTEWITTEADFHTLEPGWRALCDRSAESSVFQSWEWISAWWRAFGASRELRVAIVRQGDRLLAAAPLTMRPLGGARLLEFLGAGRTDYLGFLLDPARPDLLKMLLSTLAERSAEWDILWLRDMPLDAGGIAALRGALPAAGLRGIVRPWDVAPYLPTTGRWEDYLSQRSANFRSDLKRKRRRLEAAGPVAIERHREPVDLRAALLEAIEIERQSWKQKAGTARMSDPVGRTFFLDAAGALAASGHAELWLLRVAAQAVAFYLNFLDRRRVRYYSGTYRSDFQAMSPGKVLMAEAIHAAFEEGREEFDFLRGNESYKATWTDQCRPLYEAFIHSRRLRSRVATRLMGELLLPAKRHPRGQALVEQIQRRRARSAPGPE